MSEPLEQRDIKRGRSGIQNTGNTCFLSASLQCLSHIPEFAHNFVGYEKDKLSAESNNQYEMIQALGQTLSTLWSGNEANLNPKTIIEALEKIAPQLTDGDQHDGHEALHFILEAIDEELKKNTSENGESSTPVQDIVYDSIDSSFADESWKAFLDKNTSFISNLLYGQLCTNITCVECGHTVTKFEPFDFLHLPLVQEKIEVTVNVVLHSTLMNDEDFYLKCQPVTLQVEKDETISKLIYKLNESRNTKDQQYILLEMKKDIKGHVKYYKVKTINKVYSYINTGRSNGDTNRCLLAYPLPAIDASYNKPVFLINSYFANTKGYRSMSIPETIGLPLLIMCRENETVESLADMLMVALGHIVLYANDESNYEGEESLAVPPVYLLPGTTYNNGISSIKKFCDIMADVIPEDSEISWEETTVITPLFQDKNDNDIHLCVAKWQEIENVKRETDLSSILDDLCIRLQKANDLEVSIFNENKNSTVAEDYLKQKSAKDGEGMAINIKNCFDVFTESNFISDEAIWDCKQCNKKVYAQSTSKLWRLPPVLILHLKRFEYVATNVSPFQKSTLNNDLGKKKINTFVDFPVKDLNVLDYISPEVKNEYDNNHSTYDLIAVSNHNGDANFGHYNAYCKDMNEGEEKWLDYNDSRVTSITADKVCSRFGYILFYVRKDCCDYTSQQLIQEIKAYEQHTSEIPFVEFKPYPFYDSISKQKNQDDDIPQEQISEIVIEDKNEDEIELSEDDILPNDSSKISSDIIIEDKNNLDRESIETSDAERDSILEEQRKREATAAVATAAVATAAVATAAVAGVAVAGVAVATAIANNNQSEPEIQEEETRVNDEDITIDENISTEPVIDSVNSVEAKETVDESTDMSVLTMNSVPIEQSESTDISNDNAPTSYALDMTNNDEIILDDDENTFTDKLIQDEAILADTTTTAPISQDQPISTSTSTNTSIQVDSQEKPVILDTELPEPEVATVEEHAQENVIIEEHTQENVIVEEPVQENAITDTVLPEPEVVAVEEPTQENIIVEEPTQENIAIEDSSISPVVAEAAIISTPVEEEKEKVEEIPAINPESIPVVIESEHKEDEVLIPIADEIESPPMNKKSQTIIYDDDSDAEDEELKKLKADYDNRKLASQEKHKQYDLELNKFIYYYYYDYGYNYIYSLYEKRLLPGQIPKDEKRAMYSIVTPVVAIVFCLLIAMIVIVCIDSFF
ncbi:hypothetical protein WA158_007265 [Blastocystis sp. Blastoise]